MVLKKISKKELLYYSLLAIIYFLVCTYLLTPLLKLSSLAKAGGFTGQKNIMDGILNMYSHVFSTIAYGLMPPQLGKTFLGIVFVTIINIFILVILMNARKNGDEKGITYLEDNGTHGTSKWMHENEARKILDIRNDSKGILFGTLNNVNVALPEKTFQFNKNVAIFGAPGTGKSRSYARPNICQLVQAKQSMIITDPKGELFRDCYLFLKKFGYEVKVFNLVNMKNSDRWNPLGEVKDDLSAQLFTEVVIANTSAPGAKGDQFWEKGEQNLLKALVLYIIYELPEEDRNLKNLYKILAGSDAKQMDRLFTTLPNTHAAKAPYNIFCQASETVRTGIIIGLGTRLQVFQNQLVQSLTETSDIDLTKPGQAPCAYFCITSDMNSTFDFLSGLFFSFLFINLINYADLHDGKCNPGVYCILDEFPNIATIPDFTKKISTMRSRNVHCHVIFQNIAQLQNRYPNNGWAEIIGCCDSKLFLGCTDLITAEFVSKLVGVTTVADKSSSKSAGLEGLWDFGKETTKATKRNLLNPDEVLQFPNEKAMLMLKGQNPLILDKQDYEKHPLSKEFSTIQIKDYSPEWANSFVQTTTSNINDEIKKETIFESKPNAEKFINKEDSFVKEKKANKTSSKNKKNNSRQISFENFFGFDDGED